MDERAGDQWIADLKAGSRRREAALADLRSVVVDGLTRVLRRWRFPGRPRIDQLAEDFAQETLLRVLDNLDTFEGRSAFTTWAQKIAVRVALSELRHKRWKDRSLTLPSGESLLDQKPKEGPAPDDLLVRADMVAWVRRIMSEELTEKQLIAIENVAFGSVPMEEVARLMNTNRNALYKLIHDARKRLKARLEREGVTTNEILEAVNAR